MNEQCEIDDKYIRWMYNYAYPLVAIVGFSLGIIRLNEGDVATACMLLLVSFLVILYRHKNYTNKEHQELLKIPDGGKK